MTDTQSARVTAQWFAKYRLHDTAADRGLATTGWRNDSVTGTTAPDHGPNALSWHYRSRVDIELDNGAHFDCENLRDGCAGQTPAQQDCAATTFSVIAMDRRQIPWKARCCSVHLTDPSARRSFAPDGAPIDGSTAI